MNKYINIIAIIMLITGCKKNKPSVGKYQGSFWGTYKDSTVVISKNRYEELYIVNTDKHFIEMATCPSCNSFSITKNNKDISGVIDISRSSGAGPLYIDDVITIQGKWEMKNGEYVMTGAFSYHYKIIDSLMQKTFIVTGEFEIKSN